MLDKHFPWERFEEFCRDFVGRRPGVVRVSSYGRKGSKQKGIDFPAELSTGETWSFQCRQVKEFSRTQFETVVANDEYLANRHVVLLGCQAGRPVRDAERDLPNWEIWDATDISRMVRQLSMQDQRTLVLSHFGPHVQEAFLGIKGPAAFRTWADHFAPYMHEGRLFHHRLPIVGRDETLLDLERFINSPRGEVAVLSGRGGIGKTKVLQVFGQDHLREHHERYLLYSDEGTPFSADTLHDVPADATTLVIDDAHRRDDLAELLSFVARWPHPIKVILAIRPEGRTRIEATLAKSAIDASEVMWLTVGELTREPGQRLAEAALGAALRHLGERLYLATWDCPLVTVVGAELLRSKQLPPELLEQDADFRRAVLTKFADAALGKLGESVNHALAASVLDMVSGLQPIRPDDPNFIKSAAEFLSVQESDLIRCLASLEEVGLLLRRGYRVRLVPDVLADQLLDRASLTSHGSSTGYVDRLLDHFSSVAFDRLLANVAELDWRVRITGGSGTRLLDRIWEQFDLAFKGASNTTQVLLLRLLKDAAVYQPSPVLDLLEYAIEHPADVAEPDDLPSILVRTREDVLQAMPELIQRCAHAGHARRCCELLWRLGRDDDRPTNQFPNHPIRVLTELAGYEPHKPLTINQEVLNAVESWLGEPGAHQHHHSPLEIVEALLAKSGLEHSSDGISVQLREFLINPASTNGLRQRVLELAEDLAGADQPRVALRAVQTIEAALHDPIGYFSRTVEDTERRAWEQEQQNALAALERLAKRSEIPLLQLAVADAVAWTARRGHSSDLREVAKRILDTLADSFDLRIQRVLTRPWGTQVDLDSAMDFEAAEQKRRARMQSVADDLATQNSTGTELVDALQSQIDICADAGVKIEAGHLVGILSQSHPGLAADAAEIIVMSQGHALEPVLAQFLLGVRPDDPDRALEIALNAVERGSQSAAMAIAFLYAYGGWPGVVEPADLPILSKLLGSDNDNIRALATTGLQSFKDLEPTQAVRLALGIRVGTNAAIAEALAHLLAPTDSRVYPAVTDQDLRQFLLQIEDIDNLDGYQVRILLRSVVPRIPVDVLAMLVRRIDSVHVRGAAITRQAVPHDWSGESIWIGLSDEARVGLLRQLRQESLTLNWARAIDFPDLFADIAGDWRLATPVLEEWIQSGVEAQVVAAGALFDRAPSDFIFDHPEVVQRSLEAATRFGEHATRKMRGAFRSCANSGTKTGRMLQPFPQDIAIQNRATAVALRFADGSITRDFYEALAVDALAMINHSRKIDEEMIDGPLPTLTVE